MDSRKALKGLLRRGAALKLSKSHWLSLAMLVALLATAVIARHFSPLPIPISDMTGVVEPECDLQQRACSAKLGDDGHLEFSITPRPIPQLQPLRVEVTVAGIQPTKVEVDFAGESMSMGYNRPELRATAPGRYTGEITLPVCTTGGMVWVATVIIETDTRRISVPFRFDTRH